MRTRIQKWGNSLAVRIPKAFAREARLAPRTAVELTLVGGQLVVTPVVAAAFTLESLLAGVTPERLHREVSTGPPVGDEAW